jgi:hypothetical protein
MIWVRPRVLREPRIETAPATNGPKTCANLAVTTISEPAMSVSAGLLRGRSADRSLSQISAQSNAGQHEAPVPGSNGLATRALSCRFIAAR